MKVYTCSQARQNLTGILEESKKEEIVIRRRTGELFTLAPKTTGWRSPFDVEGLRMNSTRAELRETRERGGEGEWG